MADLELQLKQKLGKCRNTIKIGYTSTKESGISWLNGFCAEFVQFTELLHTYLLKNTPHEGTNEFVECCFLCLTQIVCCVKHMERTLKAEKAGGIAISGARQHFLDRIHYCLDKLRFALKNLENIDRGKEHSFHQPLENWSFIELLDETLDNLAPYCNYEENTSNPVNVAEENAEAIFASKQIRAHVDLMLGQTLALANVALHQDKRALSALCQKVLRECIAFEEECLSIAHKSKMPDSNRKFKAMALEKALLQLEDYINEALLRLVYRCFLDFEKFSIEKLRILLRLYEGEHDDSSDELDDVIADFDVNIDRTAQIGNFAITFAPNVKAKTIIRSALASFESLDACIIPAMHGKGNAASIYSELLEQHFNEEVQVFKNAIQEIIDSYAFTSSYYDMLVENLKQMDKQYDKLRLQELVQMGEFLYEHFQMKVNNDELQKKPETRLKMYEKFAIILRECQAILMCANQVDTKRILKRFKILRSIVHKFLDTLLELKSSTNGGSGGGVTTTTGNRLPQTSAAVAESIPLFDDDEDETNYKTTNMFETMGITPARRSVLYCQKENVVKMIPRRCVATSDSLRGNTSKFPIVSPSPPPSPPPPPPPQKPIEVVNIVSSSKTFEIGKHLKQASDDDDAAYAETKLPTSTRSYVRNTKRMASTEKRCRNSLRRRESLRTAMFKRQKTAETSQIYSIYKSHSTSLQITEILDQLTGITPDFSTIKEIELPK